MGTAALHGRTAFVTGGSGGIGRTLVQALARTGCSMGLTYASNPGAGEAAAADARAAGVDALAVQADLTDPEAGLVALDIVEERLGPVDVLVPNAGLAQRTGDDVADVGWRVWRDTMAVNIDAPFLLARQVVPRMAERGFGRVLFTSSVAGFVGGVIGPHYAASKSALHGLTAWLSSRYANRGVTINAIAPALIEGTAMLPNADQPAPVPVGRFGTTDEVVDVMMTMLRNGYLTGKVWMLDGGLRPG